MPEVAGVGQRVVQAHREPAGRAAVAMAAAQVAVDQTQRQTPDQVAAAVQEVLLGLVEMVLAVL